MSSLGKEFNFDTQIGTEQNGKNTHLDKRQSKEVVVHPARVKNNLDIPRYRRYCVGLSLSMGPPSWLMAFSTAGTPLWCYCWGGWWWEDTDGRTGRKQSAPALLFIGRSAIRQKQKHWITRNRPEIEDARQITSLEEFTKENSSILHSWLQFVAWWLKFSLLHKRILPPQIPANSRIFTARCTWNQMQNHKSSQH